MIFFRFEHRITLAYLIIGGLWILFSDKLLLGLTNDPHILSQMQTYKGWFYVVVTALLLFLFLRRHIKNLRISQKRAEESDKLKTAFIQNISHEIRTPMNSICGFSALLNNPNLTSEKKKKYTDIIKQNSDQLLSIVNDILYISNIETGQSKLYINQFNLENLIKDIYNKYQPIAQQKRIEFLIHSPKPNGNIIIISDQEKLQHILYNLLSNAIKFTHTGKVSLGYDIKENHLEFFVEDSGIGISSENQKKIFKRFIQADLSIQLRYGGTGLGLTIAKYLVEMLGGTIWVESQIGFGSKFYFTMPLKNKPSRTQSNPDTKTTRKEKNKTILIAEDEEHNYMYLYEFLSNEKTNLLRAKNGKEAVDICTNTPNIDVVIMDIKMPIMSGIEASRLIKKLRPSLPIIACTAYATASDEKAAKKVGVDEYMPKPISERKLLEMIDKYNNPE